MITEITARGFKIIDEQGLTIKNPAQINYLIGANGSGKSSFLEFLTLGVNNQITNELWRAYGALNRCFNNTKLLIKYNTGVQTSISYRISSANENKLISPNFRCSHPEEQIISVIIKCNGEIDAYFKSHNVKIVSLEFNLDNIIGFTEDSLIEFVNQKNLLNKKIVDISKSISEVSSIQLKDIEGRKVNLKTLSSGQIQLMSLFANIEKWINIIHQNTGDIGRHRIICIEEPETHFHPNWQKQIHSIFEFFIEKYPNLHFFITTHSPFIISNAGNNSKVYLIENGTTRDIEGNLNSGQEGYLPSQSASVIAEMLGADKTDIGYPENFCIVEEASLCSLLRILRNKGIISNWEFISTRGNGNISKYSEIIDDIRAQSDLLVCNPFYQSKYCIIIDKIPENESRDLIRKIDKLKTKLGNERFIELSKHALEDYYPAELKLQYDEAQNNRDKDISKGQIKVEYAEKFADLINSKEDFQKYFNNELDILF